MSALKTTRLIDKEFLGIRLDEFIKDSRSNVNDKIKIILSLISSIKDENEKIISRSK